jgi:hypothetical protein
VESVVLTHARVFTGGQIPAAVRYPGGAYHTSCAVHILTKAGPATARRAALRALRDLAAAPPEAALAPLTATLERALRGGDPGLHASLISALGEPYGRGDAALDLPDADASSRQHAQLDRDL